VPATRIEIAEHTAEAFTGATVTREQLLTIAAQTGARPEVLEVLERLPDVPFHELRELWPDLPDVPIEPTSTSATPTP
jgi:Protein of unknown function (DUF2795)